jgi:site-specific DNA-methyltransferase (adenine-specific)
MGSGTTLVAAHLNKRHGVGIEVDEDYCKLAKERIDQATNQLHLFEREEGLYGEDNS